MKPLATPKVAAGAGMPRTLFGYIWKISGRHQVALVPMTIAVFLLSTVPLELQRRIVNDAIAHGATGTILWLAIAYAGLAMAEGAIKLCLNVYRSWVSESTIFNLRRSIGSLPVDAVKSEDRAMAEGVEISMILSEAEPIGGFVGISISDPLLHGGLLASVFGYLFYLEPRMALLGLLVFSPQLVFVPLLQRAIIVRGAERIRTLRGISGEIVGAQGGIPAKEESMRHVFSLSMGIFKLKFTMNFLMNLMHHSGVAVALGVGGWLAVKGEIEVGTVVAFVSGLGKVNDPWGDLVNWFREMTAVTMRYELVADAMRWLAKDGGMD
jgi:ABC-type multidrug transport system fused ATPase/permease subunit